MSRTPFELRYELLQFAHGCLQNEYHSKLEVARMTNVKSNMPVYPTKEDVFALADEYKNFIEKK